MCFYRSHVYINILIILYLYAWSHRFCRSQAGFAGRGTGLICANLQHFQIQLATKGDAGVQALLAYAGKARTPAAMLTT